MKTSRFIITSMVSIIAPISSGCSAESTEAPAVSLGDSAAVKNLMAKAEVAVIFSRGVQASNSTRGAVAFAGSGSTKGYIAADTVEHAAISYAQDGRLGFALEDKLVSLGRHIRVDDRMPSARRRGAVGQALAASDGSFYYYFNVGEDASSRYSQTIESPSLKNPVVIDGIVTWVANCESHLVASVKTDGTRSEASSTGLTMIPKRTGSPVVTSRATKPEFLTQEKDSMAPCRDGHIYSLRTPSPADTAKGQHTLVDMDISRGTERRIALRLPAGQAPKRADATVNQVLATELLGNSLMWVTVDGRLFATSLADGTTRLVGTLATGSPTAWRLFSIQGRRIAVYEPYAEGPRLRVHDLASGRHIKDVDTTALDETQRVLGSSVIPTGIALAPGGHEA